MHPLVVHVRRCRPANCVYVGRGSEWGNIYTHMPLHLTLAERQARSRSEAIALYERWLLDERPDLVARLPELRGRLLACWCAPLPCHADVLARLANGPPIPGVGAGHA